MKKIDLLKTSKGQPRGYIQPQVLKELWFHTGSICNLSCSFCLEGSGPGDSRIEKMLFGEVKLLIDEALFLGVEQFSFTGGEPFVIKDIIDVLSYALDHRPCLVLTNATKPLKERWDEIIKLKGKSNSIKFRVSLDYPDPKKHDVSRGEGSFQLALEMLGRLYKEGFAVSIARQMAKDENVEEVDQSYQKFFQQVDLPQDTNIVKFPDFLKPGEIKAVPEITEDCMTRYHTEATRAQFMCHNTKMVLKKKGCLHIYACTLVDDDEDYGLGDNLTESLKPRITLKHHRCYSCFAYGASCSEK
ncbi:Radical SAM domain protein [hydrothermal vent metagenome]|uniref:Radical SAM domain protein n=1 Tax=hydrothermal vent metagenome TaxID=652676 RepID=A0A3B1D7X9_9ZZZZ